MGLKQGSWFENNIGRTVMVRRPVFPPS